MDTGLYSAFLGMRARQRALDATANNIANSSTAGFKAERLFYTSLEAAESAAAGGGAAATPQTNTPPPVRSARALGVVAGGAADFAQGPLRETGRPLDVALVGDGFLVVQTPRGERYTRAGNLTLDSAGQLVTQRGDLVVGQSGPVTVPPGEVTVGEDGTLSVDGKQIDQLKLVRFNDPRAALVKEGDSLFVATGGEKPAEAAGTRVTQGALEQSNVNTISEMVAMMQNSREFESLQRSITLMGKSTADIGKI